MQDKRNRGFSSYKEHLYITTSKHCYIHRHSRTGLIGILIKLIQKPRPVLYTNGVPFTFGCRWITEVIQTLKSYHQEFHHIISAAPIHSPIGAPSNGGFALY